MDAFFFPRTKCQERQNKVLQREKMKKKLVAIHTGMVLGSQRSLQVRAAHKGALMNTRDPAHDFTVKLSPSMCSHSSCLAWRNCDFALVRT